MMPFSWAQRAMLMNALIFPALGQVPSGCSTTLTPTNSIKLCVASGYQAALVATGLTSPRSIQFDGSGNLLVVEQSKGVTSLHFDDNGGICVSVMSQDSVVEATDLTHGLALSQDGYTLYASSAEAAYSWAYNPANSTVLGSNRTLVSGMYTDIHNTRTLLTSRKINDTLVISRGSSENVDPAAGNISSGRSQIKAFDLSKVPSGGYSFAQDGLRLGWGLRNSVGVSEHPQTGGIYSVENSVDDLNRTGRDIHQDNPGEELNFHGYLNGTEYAPQGSNYGYPYCVAAWNVSGIPMSSNLTVGSQIAIDSQNDTINDTYCKEQTTGPRLTFQAHMAPDDIKFNDSGNEAWVTFHGSWDRIDPVGYKVSLIPFTNGEPVAAPDNNTAMGDVLANADNSACPDHCFRPVGIAFDDQGRLFMSSDASGEIYVIVKDELANKSSTAVGGGGSGDEGGKVSGSVNGRGTKGIGWVVFGVLAGLFAV